MVAQAYPLSSASKNCFHSSHQNHKFHTPQLGLSSWPRPHSLKLWPQINKFSINCSGNPSRTLRTCKNCKTQFDPAINHPRACRFHTAHFGGETKRKFESVYEGGTMNTPNSGQVLQYWHCCGSEDPFDLGCSCAPHMFYDD